MTPQWPIVGRGDLYYGGDTYENKQGLGVHLSLTGPLQPDGNNGEGAKRLRPEENQWLAVPMTRLYDLGVTVRTSELLRSHIGEASVILHPEAAKSLAIQSGDLLKVNDWEARAILDENVPTGVVLVPRSMGLPVGMPVVAKLKKG